MYILGKRLADIALPEGKVRNLFRQNLLALKAGEGLRIRLHLDPLVLVHLPWEFMALSQTSGESKPSDFLALRREISIVRTDTVESAVRPLPAHNQVRIVAVLSSPLDQPHIEVNKDKRAIQKALQNLQKAVGQSLIQVTWVEEPATRQTVEQALEQEVDIFHFAGHAIFDEQGGNEGYILLEKADGTSERYSGEQLAQLLRNAGVRLVILGACDTGRRNGRNMWNGIAPALTREKITAVVAHQFNIYDDCAILLADKVYYRVLAGFTIDESLFEARQAMYQYKGLENRDWGAPVLYSHDKDGILFPTPGADSASSIPGRPLVHVANAFNEVSGEVVDVDIQKAMRGDICITDTIEVIKKDGMFTSLKIDELG